MYSKKLRPNNHHLFYNEIVGGDAPAWLEGSSVGIDFINQIASNQSGNITFSDQFGNDPNGNGRNTYDPLVDLKPEGFLTTYSYPRKVDVELKDQLLSTVIENNFTLVFEWEDVFGVASRLGANISFADSSDFNDGFGFDITSSVAGQSTGEIWDFADLDDLQNCSFVPGEVNRFAISKSGLTVSYSINGGTAITNTLSLTLSMSIAEIFAINGFLRKILVWDTALSDGQIQALSTVTDPSGLSSEIILDTSQLFTGQLEVTDFINKRMISKYNGTSGWNDQWFFGYPDAGFYWRTPDSSASGNTSGSPELVAGEGYSPNAASPIHMISGQEQFTTFDSLVDATVVLEFKTDSDITTRQGLFVIGINGVNQFYIESGHLKMHNRYLNSSGADANTEIDLGTISANAVHKLAIVLRQSDSWDFTVTPQHTWSLDGGTVGHSTLYGVPATGSETWALTPELGYEYTPDFSGNVRNPFKGYIRYYGAGNTLYSDVNLPSLSAL
jgi:hypothetical protein